MTAMAIMVLFAGVTLAALMTMTLTTSQISETQKLSTREVRAADNALESAVNLIRMDPAGELGNFDDCLGGTPIDLSTNNRTVTVTATCEESDRAMPVRDSALGAAPSVQLVGADGYRGSFTADSVPWKVDCLRPIAKTTACFPWSYGMSPANYDATGSAALSTAAPSLVHSGGVQAAGSTLNQTLHFASNVSVRRGAAAVIDTASASPAINVTGRYAQGDLGLLGTSTLRCGLSTAGHVWNVLAARIVDADEAAGTPECGDGTAAGLSDRLEIAPRPGLGEIFNVFATVPSCTGGPGTVLEFQPGAYGKAQTQKINDLLDGSCPNHTFWFRPASATVAGNYWFDVDDTTHTERAMWNSLIIADPSAKVIFGTPAGGLSAAAAGSATFPAACNAEAAGVEVILSPRTSLRHTGGRVAMCDRDGTLSTTNVPAALWQAGSTNSGWQGHPDPAISTVTRSKISSGITWGDEGTSDAAGSWRPGGGESHSWFECNGFLYANCQMDVTYSARDIGTTNVDGSAKAAPSPGRVDTLDLIVNAEVEDDNGFSLVSNGQVGSLIAVYRAGESTPACQVYFPFKQRSMGAGQRLVLAYDLRSLKAQAVPGQTHCRDAALTREQLHGSRVDLTIRQQRSIYVLGWKTSNVYVDSIELRSGWDLEPTSVDSSTGWSDAGNLLPDNEFASASDGDHAGFTLKCGTFSGCPTATRTVTLGKFDNTVVPWSPSSGTLRAAGVIVTGETTNQNWFAGGSFYDIGGEPDVSRYSKMTATLSNLRDVPGGSCTASWNKVPFWGQSVYLNLLDPAVAGSCSSVLTSAEQLIGASVSLQVYLERNQWGSGADFGVRIDSVRLSTVTDGEYTHPKLPNLITVGDGPSDDSSFNIYGQVSMPRNDLNIRWNGPSPRNAEGEPVPLGGGNMILNGLGSYVGPEGEAGVICCSPTKPAERIMTLTASVTRGSSTRVAGEARILVSDSAGPGAGLWVQDWRIG